MGDIPHVDDVVIECGNQHTCTFEFDVAALERTVRIEVKGAALANILGFAGGPRPLVWKSTLLEGDDEDLGHISVSLDPDRDHAGTLIPVAEGAPFPAVNRNAYYFLVTVGSVGELRSRRPAIVEGTIDGIPPDTTYELQNGPLEFYVNPDADDAPVAVLTDAQTRVGNFA